MIKSTSKAKVVYDHLLMRATQQPVGMVLPSMVELQKKFSVSPITVLRAFDTLEAMGRIKRMPGKGVFVDSPANTGEIAIAITPRLLLSEASLYYARTVAALSAEISYQTKNLHVRLHLGKDMGLSEYTIEKYSESLELDDPETILKLRGVITFSPISDKLLRKLVSYGIPVCLVSSDSQFLLSVSWNREFFLRKSLEFAASRRLKDICFFGFSGWQFDPDNEILKLERLMKEYGLKPHPEWRLFIEKRMTEDIGYQLFNRLWSFPNKPQLIIAIDDIACSGMLKAVNEKGLDIPRDFQLITSANKGINFPYGKKITCYEVDGAIQAQKAVGMVLNHLEKGTADQAETIILDPVFIQGQTTL